MLNALKFNNLDHFYTYFVYKNTHSNDHFCPKPTKTPNPDKNSQPQQKLPTPTKTPNRQKLSVGTRLHDFDAIYIFSVSIFFCFFFADHVLY
jgi:hypothetical protein